MAAKPGNMLYIVMGIIVVYFALLMLFIGLVGRKKRKAAAEAEEAKEE